MTIQRSIVLDDNVLQVFSFQENVIAIIRESHLAVILEIN